MRYDIHPDTPTRSKAARLFCAMAFAAVAFSPSTLSAAEDNKPRGPALDFNVLYPRANERAGARVLPPDAITLNFAANGFVPIDWQMYKDPYWGFGGGEVANYLSDSQPQFQTIYADLPLNLPVGSQILSISGVVVDNHANWDAVVAVNSTDLRGATFTSCYAYSTTSATMEAYADIAASCDMTVQRNRIYTARIVIPPAGSALRVASVSVHYVTPMAPAPSVPSFADVPSTSPFYRSIEALAKSGLTSGCGGGNFCPDAAVTRAQLAFFLAKALGLGW